MQKANIVLVEKPDIVDFVEKHGDSLHTHPKGVTRILFAVITYELEYFGTHHSSTRYFNPPCSFTHPTPLSPTHKTGKIVLGTGFGKRKEAGTESNLHVRSEHPSGKHEDDSLQIGKGHTLIHAKAFDLMKDRRMGGIRCIPSVATSRCNDSHRRRLALHHANLDRRGMGSENDLFVNVKGILYLSGRMLLGEIQSFEVVIIGLDFRTLSYGKSHLLKTRFNPPENQGDGMIPPYR